MFFFMMMHDLKDFYIYMSAVCSKQSKIFSITGLTNKVRLFRIIINKLMELFQYHFICASITIYKNKTVDNRS